LAARPVGLAVEGCTIVERYPDVKRYPTV